MNKTIIAGILLWSKRIVFYHGNNKNRKKQIISSLLVVSVSMIPLIVSIILSNGMIQGITNKYISLQSGHIQIYNYDPKISEDNKIVEIIKNYSTNYQIKNYLITEGNCLIYSKSGSFESSVRGVTQLYLEEVLSKEFSYTAVINGQQKILNSEKNILISEYMAQKLSVTVGDTVTLMSIKENEIGTIFKPTLFTIGGIFKSGYQALDEKLLFINQNKAEYLFPNTYSTHLEIHGQSLELKQIEQLYQKLRNTLDDKYSIITWKEINRGLFDNFQMTKILLFIIMAVILSVAGVNISSMCIMLIQENTKEIGIFRALGIDVKYIFWSFFISIISISFIGGILGILLGLFVGYNIPNIFSMLNTFGLTALDYYLIDIPIIIHSYELLLVFLFTQAITIIASFLPLKKIFTILPIDILKE